MTCQDRTHCYQFSNLSEEYKTPRGVLLSNRGRSWRLFREPLPHIRDRILFVGQVSAQQYSSHNFDSTAGTTIALTLKGEQ